MNRRYDFSIEDSLAWTQSEERKQLMDQSEETISTFLAALAFDGESLS